MPFAFGDTVTHHVAAVGIGPDGNDQITFTDVTLTGVPFWPRSSTETLQGMDVTQSVASIIVPATVTVQVIDKFTVRGVTYDVNGRPTDYTQDPWTGASLGYLVQLKEVTG